MTLRVRALSDEEKSSLTQLVRSRTRGAQGRRMKVSVPICRKRNIKDGAQLRCESFP